MKLVCKWLNVTHYNASYQVIWIFSCWYHLNQSIHIYKKLARYQVHVSCFFYIHRNKFTSILFYEFCWCGDCAHHWSICSEVHKIQEHVRAVMTLTFKIITAFIFTILIQHTHNTPTEIYMWFSAFIIHIFKLIHNLVNNTIWMLHTISITK